MCPAPSALHRAVPVPVRDPLGPRAVLFCDAGIERQQTLGLLRFNVQGFALW